MSTNPQTLGTTVRDALARHEELRSVSDSALLDCQLLLGHALGKPRSWLYAHGEDLLCEDARMRFESFMAQRSAGVPVAYITGQRWFWNMALEVTPATLIPRPETELLVETVLDRLTTPHPTLLDAGTGTGAIAIALASERPEWNIIASDFSAAALAVAAGNIKRWADDKVDLVQGHWLTAFPPASFDAIVSNPPYIREGDEHLYALKSEPLTALASGPDGLDAIAALIEDALRCLRPGGLLILEHGFDQASAVCTLAHQHGYTGIETLQDFNSQPRALVAYKPL